MREVFVALSHDTGPMARKSFLPFTVTVGTSFRSSYSAIFLSSSCSECSAPPYPYTDDEVLESTIVSDEASHYTYKGSREEIWKAYGNVVVKNLVNNQTMESDTIYWDQSKKEIYTDCYVRMYSPDGLIQGYGMRSDERARNAIVLNPFNNFGVVVKDSTEVIIDSVNFIGPLLEK